MWRFCLVECRIDSAFLLRKQFALLGLCFTNSTPLWGYWFSVFVVQTVRHYGAFGLVFLFYKQCTPTGLLV